MNEQQIKANITYYKARLNQTIKLADMYMDRLDELKQELKELEQNA